MRDFDIPKGTLCAKSCGRKAVSWYGDHISAMDMAHGNFGRPWCRRCITERQLEYAKEQAKRINILESNLSNLIRVEEENS